ncbi:MAG: glutathione synthase [Deltaproteobacteria bacterium]|nr:glutathione synthase [Deltaproteobacteria bacterium]
MRALKIGVIMDPIDKIDIDKDTTFVLMLEAQKRGHKLYYMELDDLSARGATPEGHCRRVSVVRGKPHHEFAAAETKPLQWFDIILMRKDPPFDMKFFFATHLLSLVDERKSLVVNHPRALREANEKLYALNFPALIPPTLVDSNMERLKQFLKEQGGEMVIKPLDGCGGSGVFYLNQKDRNTNSLLETATQSGRNPIMAQRYVPEVRQGDKRIVVLDGEPLGAILRVPREDETRSNIHVGGRVVKADLAARDREICRAMAPSLKKLGLYFVGLDVIGNYLTEVNVTSPTGVQEINALDKIQLEKQVIDFIEKEAGKLHRS